MAPEPHVVLASAGRAVTALLGGLAIGVWTAAYQGHLRAYRPRRVLLFMLDVAFWLGVFVLAALGLYLANWMSLRLYAFVAMGTGVVTALALAGPGVRALAWGVTRLSLTVLRGLVWPVRFARRARRPHFPV